MASSYEFAVIFEDDVCFDARSLETTLNQLIACGERWDICNLDIRKKGEKKSFYTTVAHLGKRDLRLYYRGVYCADAYIVNRYAAKCLVSKALPLVMTIEDYFVRGWEFDLKYLALYPRLVDQQDVPSVLAAQPCVDVAPEDLLPRRWAAFSGRIYRLKTGLIRAFYTLKLAAGLWWSEKYT